MAEGVAWEQGARSGEQGARSKKQEARRKNIFPLYACLFVFPAPHSPLPASFLNFPIFIVPAGN
jgi:hypothetical protein